MEEKDLKKDLENDSILNEKYTINSKIGEGEHAKVYLVTDINKETYAAKILKENQEQVDINAFYREIEILKKINEVKGSERLIIKYYDSGKGDIKKGSLVSSNRDYLINNYFPNGNLYTYLKKTKTGFEEKYAKIIFWKILEGIKFLHDLSICHLDIKLDNIVLDSHYNPIIMDFGLSSEMIKKGPDDYEYLKQNKGTPKFMCPEMFKMVKYKGIQADIFSLGVVLIYLVSNKNAFVLANKSDDSYKKFIKKDYKGFWDSFINNEPHLIKISEELKKLYFKLIAYLESNRPKNISEIFNDPWLADVKNYTNEDYQQYENYMINLENQKDNETLENNNQTNLNNQINEGNRSMSNDDENYFGFDIKPKCINKTGLNAMNYIKINGYLNPIDFMSFLLKKLRTEFNCGIHVEDKKKLKFEATFTNEIRDELEKYESSKDEEEGEQEVDLADIFQLKDSIIMIKLFESINGGYEIHFIKKQGEYMEYSKHFEEIKNIIKDYLNAIKEN